MSIHPFSSTYPVPGYRIAGGAVSTTATHRTIPTEVSNQIRGSYICNQERLMGKNFLLIIEVKINKKQRTCCLFFPVAQHQMTKAKQLGTADLGQISCTCTSVTYIKKEHFSLAKVGLMWTSRPVHYRHLC